MFVLGIDTATNSGGVALARNREVVGLILLKIPLRYSDFVVPMIDFLLRRHQVRLDEVGCLGVASGPGSFTGVRVGLAVAKALGQAREIPAVGVSTLEALAFELVPWRRPVAVMLDARRQQVYGAAYRPAGDHGDRLERIVPEQVDRPEAFLRKLPDEEFLFVGDGARLYRGAVDSVFPGALVMERDNRVLDAICELAFRRYGEGLSRPVAQLSANYVRPSDVQLNKKLNT